MAPLKVVFVDHSDEPGGAEFALLRLLRPPRPWRATVALPPSSSAGDDVFTSGLPSGVSTIRSGPRHAARKEHGTGLRANVGLAARILRSGLALATHRQVRDADVLVANTTRASVYVAITGLALGKPFVVHIRDLIRSEAIGSAAALLMRRLVLPRAAGVIANSRASLDTAKDAVRTDNIAVIPSPAGLNPVAVESVNTRPRVDRIGMVARIDPWKGQEQVLRAFAQACATGDQTLVFYGGPAFGHETFDSELRDLARNLGIADRVEFAGHTSDVAGAIETLDVCIQASTRAEPLGQNVLQYLSAGKPTIVSGEGGPVEWVTDHENGLVFTPRDVASLSAAIVKFVEDRPLRQRLAENAARTPGLRTDERVGDEVLAVLHKAASA
ncbi:D-inositol-3-phosphate glycosyltransferase [Microbacterium sp. MM2322]|uniref:glycosyltransferase family 4 protein n=1 Tax=Microbacterium sp. MM2322 TaxID=3157631 RepID=UPI003D8066E2